jgi:ribonuclease HII
MRDGSLSLKKIYDSAALFQFEEQIRRQNIRFLCGIDEAGRGALAGPVVAAAVMLPPGTEIAGVNDSKQLSAAERERLYPIITAQASGFGIGLADPAEIDRLNILQATFLAMKRAVDQLDTVPQYILVDGRDFPVFTYQSSVERLPGRAVIKGDGKSLSIAAASILAKVYRDRMMRGYHAQYPQFGFDRHKGYGTEQHRRIISEQGACPLHRRSFIRKITGSPALKS